MLRTMRAIEGWLEDEEAELLAIAAREVLSEPGRRRTLVEVGSYCGKATFVLASVARTCSAEACVVAIDTFDGVVGSLDHGLLQRGPNSAIVHAHVGRDSTGAMGETACWTGAGTGVGQARRFFAGRWAA
jgi:uncharacterized SAM-dependent methyltransferase